MKATTLALVLLLVATTLTGHCYAHKLKVGYYNGKCGHKNVEKVIYDVVKKKIAGDPDTVSDLVRLSFHDCFVRGCDGSIFLDGNNTEKAAKLNQDLGGFDTMTDLKSAIEEACPGLVSCADVLVIGARAAISLAGGKWYEVETGRKDSLVSRRSEVHGNIPPPTISVPDAIKLFAKKGLCKDDFVVLLGGHTVGTAHCHSFKERLYNFHHTNKPDPTISSSLLHLLRKTCSKTDGQAFLDQTPKSHFTIDNAYYKEILVHKGVMEIDQNMADSPLTKGLVRDLAFHPHQFLDLFGPAMVKMGRIGVLTGNEGEVRKVCNSPN